LNLLNKLKSHFFSFVDLLREWLMLLPIRIFISYEFVTSGLMKFNSNNWFANYQDNFLFPFNLISVEISWFFVTWTEILGGLCLLFGLFTRFWATGLIIISVVAISGVHWPADWNNLSELWKGYSIRDEGFGNFKIPLLLISMLIPLALSGAGKLSIDALRIRSRNK